MPAARPRASFEPIPPDFDVKTFVESVDNFQYVDRISYSAIAANGDDKFEKLVLLHVIIGGKPLVIDGFDEVLDPWTFTPSWLRDNHGDKVEQARNLATKDNIPLTIKHYLKHMSKLTDQFFEESERHEDKNRQRIYLKDIDCPPVWESKLKEHIPPSLFYLNDNTGDMGGPGALNDSAGRPGRGIARAGDLMSSLPAEMRAENLMCYIGHEGTYTPSHREMCASLGQNIMVDATGIVSEDGKSVQPGSSLWFMTESKDRHAVAEYWLSVLGHDIEVENHFAQLIAWKKAPFKTYVVEQRPGDFILIPPLAPHQVWNRGTRTMKVAWNRTTVETLEMALGEALPNSRIVCRDEQYKNKSIVYYTLLKYSELIKIARGIAESGGEQAELVNKSHKIRQVQRDFKRLFALFKTIMLSEMFFVDSGERAEFVPYDSNVTCSYCRCNIFNRFLTCKACKNLFSEDIEEQYDVCMDCYCMGRSCGCQSGYIWVEQWKWKDLMERYEVWRAQIIDIDGYVTKTTPLPLLEEKRFIAKKTLGQVCQEQLRVRPFVDIKNPEPEPVSDKESPIVDEYGNIKKASNKKSKQWLNSHKSCHFCLRRHPKWKMATCTNCDLSYCYGTLFRAHDMMPITVMENNNWICPHCLRVCNTGNCRRDPRQSPYEPKGTLLGHDTKKVADPRSVECLVDFSVSNLNFLREEEGMGEAAMQRRLQQAELDKSIDPSLDARFLDEDLAFPRHGITYSPVGNGNGFHNAHSNQSQADGNIGYDSIYPDPDKLDYTPRLGQKRRHDEDDEFMTERGKKNKKKKKDDAEDQQLKNVLGAQYQKEVPRKLLEEAKRDDRSILLAARMKGKLRIVTMKLQPYLLEPFLRRPVPSRPKAARQQTPEDFEATNGTNSILQSDILPKSNAPANRAAKAKDLKTYRVRVEAYSTRKRSVDPGASAPAGKPGRRVEEITLDSDEDFDNDDDGYSGRPGKQASKWLVRRKEGEEDLPTELPENWRDGRRRERNPNSTPNTQQKPKPPKPKAGIRPVGRPPGRPPMHANTFTAINSVTEDDAPHAEGNLRAKIGLFPESDYETGLIDGFLSDQDVDDEAPFEDDEEPADIGMASGPPPATNSLLSQPGMAGKKIKITAAKRDEPSTRSISRRGDLGSLMSRKGQVVDISSSDSESDVPATAPEPKKPGRPKMVPTRGGPARGRGRGRGRPRKTL